MNIRMKTRTILCAVLISLTFLPTLGPSQHAPDPETLLVSVNSAGTGSGNSDSSANVMSADGRFVAFGSYASDLVANDTNGKFDVFVRSLKK